jgi:hypothetical protein
MSMRYYAIRFETVWQIARATSPAEAALDIYGIPLDECNGYEECSDVKEEADKRLEELERVEILKCVYGDYIFERCGPGLCPGCGWHSDSQYLPLTVVCCPKCDRKTKWEYWVPKFRSNGD